VLFTTIGAASWPRFTAVENVKAVRSRETVSVLISDRLLNRHEAKFFAGRIHCPSSGGKGSDESAGADPCSGSRAAADLGDSGRHAADATHHAMSRTRVFLGTCSTFCRKRSGRLGYRRLLDEPKLTHSRD